MPIQIDKKPGRKQLRRSGEEPGPIKPSTEAPPERATKRVRIVRGFTCRLGVFRPGQSVTLEANTACSWIGFGLAEEDKSLDGPPEIK